MYLTGDGLSNHIDSLQERMREAASELEFEDAARLRDEIQRLRQVDLGIGFTNSLQQYQSKRSKKSSGQRNNTK